MDLFTRKINPFLGRIKHKKQLAQAVNSAILCYVLQFLCDNLHNGMKFSIIVVTFCKEA